MLAGNVSRPRTRKRGMVVSSVLVFLLVGCASPNSDIPLTLPTELFKLPLDGGKRRHMVVVTPFSDGRGRIARCGRRIHNNGWELADVICQSDPMAWIADRFVAELRAAGFNVLTDDQANRPNLLRVEGTLLRLFAEPVPGRMFMGLEADIEVALSAISGSGLISERTFFLKSWKAGSDPSVARNYEVAMGRASDALVEEMVRAIIELMDRYPQLGSGPALETGSDLAHGARW